MNRIIAFFLLLLLLPLLLLIFIIVKFTSKGPVLIWSERVGINSNIFLMPKIRTMYVNTPIVASDKLFNPEIYITPIGLILRKLSIDEIPQLYSIIIGDMNFIGPRPALFNQYELIEKRQKFKIDNILPGITGYAQINGRDYLSIDEKIDYDLYYLRNKSFFLNFKIIIFTVLFFFNFKNISH